MPERGGRTRRLDPREAKDGTPWAGFGRTCRGDGHTWGLAQFPKMGSTLEDQAGPGKVTTRSVWGVLGRGYPKVTLLGDWKRNPGCFELPPRGDTERQVWCSGTRRPLGDLWRLRSQGHTESCRQSGDEDPGRRCPSLPPGDSPALAAHLREVQGGRGPKGRVRWTTRCFPVDRWQEPQIYTLFVCLFVFCCC